MAELVLAIFGPTASGKSAVAEEVTRRIPAELVSADAMQIYRGLPVLTNQSEFPTRLVGVLGLDEEGSVADYQLLAHAAIDEILAAGRMPVVVGGTGLYLQAALTDLELRPPPPPGVRERFLGEADRRGVEALHAELAERSPTVAAAVEPTDRTRVVRALELLEMGEDPPPGGAESRLWTAALRRHTVLCGLTLERDRLYEQIDARVDAMVAAGAPDEVRRADAAGASATARKALGFEELLRGDVDAMKRRTRNYAKRQLTWMRRLERAHLVDAADDPADRLLALVKEEEDS